MSNKEIFLENEGDKWFSRNLSVIEKRSKSKSIELLYSWLQPHANSINKICEVGCGSGHNLSYLSEKLEATGRGIDPSKKAISYIREKFPKIDSVVGSGDKIKFKSNQFDLVHLGFFLYLVDPEYFPDCISEADRILKNGGFLSILDFDVPNEYSNKYIHHADVHVHKLDYCRAFLDKGNYVLAHKYSFSHKSFYFDKNIDERISISLMYKDYNTKP